MVEPLVEAMRPKKLQAARGLPQIATDSIPESISDGVFTVDSEWRVSSFNRAAEQITGVARRDAIGRLCSDVFRASMCESDCALRRTMETGAPIVNKATFIVNAEGTRIPISVSTAPLKDERGVVVGGAETFRDLSAIEELRKEIRGRWQVGDIVSRSASMRRILDMVPRIAESDSTILLQGETGTGKELVARAIHGLSPRRDGPFVAVNCGALPDTLLESELFGYKAASAAPRESVWLVSMAAVRVVVMLVALRVRARSISARACPAPARRQTSSARRLASRHVGFCRRHAWMVSSQHS